MASFQGSEEERFEPRMIVRAFSMRIKAQQESDSEEGPELNRALTERVDDDEIQRRKRIRQIDEYLNSTKPQELAKLSHHKQAAESAMRDFSTRIQRAQSKDGVPRKLETWEDVASSVEDMMTRLKDKQDTNKFRRATELLRRFCNTIKAHSSALKMLPTNNDYVKVFYGALATALQASEGYTKIMEILPKALTDINDAVAAIEKRLWLFENDAMKCYAWRIYSQIFSFLTEVISWYTKRSMQRLISSFNESLPEFFDDQVKEIQKLSRLVHDEANLRMQADSQITKLYLEGIDEKIDRIWTALHERDRVLERRYERFHEALEGKRRDELWNPESLEKILVETWNTIRKQDVGHAMTEILEEHARRRLPQPSDFVNDQRDRAFGSSYLLGFRKTTQAELDERDTPENTRDAMLLASAGLEDYFNRDSIMMTNVSDSDGNFADPAVADRIRSWIMAVDGKILYTAGMDPTRESSQVSKVAGQYALIAREAGLPVCSYSCSLKAEDPPPRRTRETIELVALVYSLLRQVIELLPSSAGRQHVMTESFRWEDFDGTLDSFPRALQNLEVLLRSTKHAVVIIIIDGIDWLDDPSHRSTDSWLTSLIMLFSKLTSPDQGTTFKIWFNSSGRSSTLFGALDSSQIALSSLPGGNMGRQGLGGELIVL